MKCPKCGHEQTNRVECESCGIFFEKYAKRHLEDSEPNQPAEGQHPVPTITTKNNKKSWLIVGSTLGIAAVLSLIFVLKSYKSSQNNVPVFSETVVDATELPDDAAIFQDINPTNLNQGFPGGLRTELQQNYPPRNNIEKATLATVFIRSPWGVGSGFFVNDGCYIITNRHVVEFDRRQIDTINEQLRQQEEFIEKEEQFLEEFEVDMYRNQDERYRQKFKPRLEQRKERLEQVKIEYENARSKLDDIQMSAAAGEFMVTLIDNRELSAQVSQVSETYDLALLSINEVSCPCIEPDLSPSLEQGQKVYTIGSPVGLKHTVTSGIVSGLRRYEGNVYIQTDAPINPGNSGGPLIDMNGKIIGVNTMVVRNAVGIGFATPIKAVFDEFDLNSCRW
jgi:serine protease Do